MRTGLRRAYVPVRHRPRPAFKLVYLRPNAEFLNGEIFYTLEEARVLIESWRRHCSATRPHSSLGFGPPAPEPIVPPSWLPGSAPLRQPPSLAEKPATH